MAAEFRLHNVQWAIGTVIFIAVTSLALGYLARFVARLRGLSLAEQRKTFWGFTFAGPWIVGFIIFVVGPAAASLIYSFTDYKIGMKLSEIDWIGLDNYRKMLLVEGATGRQFNKAMINSFYYALIGVPLQITASLVMAMLLNNELPGIRVFRMIFYLPVILAGGPALLLAWRYMLGANGGFINEALQTFADSFILFDYIYRAFIYVMESFNGFYTGITRSDPIGPLKYTIPAFFGVLLLLTMLGEWSEGKRVRAWRVAQIIALIVFYRLAYQGLVQTPVNPLWALFWAIAILCGISLAAWVKNARAQRLWQWGGLTGTVLLAGMVADWATWDVTSRAALEYLVPLAITAAGIGLSLLGAWSRTKLRVMVAAAALLSVVLLVQLVPGEMDGGRLHVFSKYLTFRSTLETTRDADYLTNVYPYDSMSTLWVYGLVIAVLVALAALNNRYPRTQRYLIIGALVFFAVFAFSSFFDARQYFGAYESLARESGQPNYHFALFRQASNQFPENNRVPLWMTSELWSKPALILITMWSSGAGMLIFLAALKGVPAALYEAAEVDGANVVQRFTRITLPMISPAMFYNIVIGVIAALQTFDNVYILQTPTTQDSISSAAYFLYVRTFRQLNIGEGSAMSWILVVVILTLTVLQFRFSKDWVHYGA